jgi:hypothetical protein
VNIKRQIERVLRSHQDNDSPALNAALELLCDSLEDECPDCGRGGVNLNESKTLCFSCQAGDEE